MTRSGVALVLLISFLGLNFGLRTLLHWRRTGHTGFRGITGSVGSLEWLGGVLFVLGIVLALAAPIAERLGKTDSLFTPKPWSDLASLALVVTGVAGTWWAQSAMGASWRIGVKADEHTELIESGPFRWVRNPIFSFMLLTAIGIALFLPNVLSLAALFGLLLAVELQVRMAEEPYLRRVHGPRYAAYSSRVGRFFPWVGREGRPEQTLSRSLDTPEDR